MGDRYNDAEFIVALASFAMSVGLRGRHDGADRAYKLTMFDTNFVVTADRGVVTCEFEYGRTAVLGSAPACVHGVTNSLLRVLQAVKAERSGKPPRCPECLHARHDGKMCCFVTTGIDCACNHVVEGSAGETELIKDMFDGLGEALVEGGYPSDVGDGPFTPDDRLDGLMRGASVLAFNTMGVSPAHSIGVDGPDTWKTCFGESYVRSLYRGCYEYCLVPRGAANACLRGTIRLVGLRNAVPFGLAVQAVPLGEEPQRGKWRRGLATERGLADAMVSALASLLVSG